MYEVIIYDGPNDHIGTVIHSPFPNDIKLSSGTVNLVLQGISNMSFTINIRNPGWAIIKPLKTLIKVRDLKRNKIIFNGRVLKPTQEMTSAGMFSVTYECESIKAYLHDSCQRWGEYHNISVRNFLQIILNNHNRQVEPYKQFKLGRVTVTDTNDSLYRYLGYEGTYDTIKDKLLDRLGGFLIVREEIDGNYIDYLESYGMVSSTPIRLRTNLKDMKREIDPLGVITRLVVLGKTIESEEETNTEASQPRLTIASVNGGKDYLDDEEMIAEFGVIEGTLIYDDITEPSVLKTRGLQFFADQKAAKVTYTLTPVDLNLINTTFDSFELGNWHPVENPVFGINENLQVIEKNIDLLNPINMRLTIGEKYKTLSQYQIEANKSSQKVIELQNLVNFQAQKIVILKEELNTTNQELTSTKQNLNQTNQNLNQVNQKINNLLLSQVAREEDAEFLSTLKYRTTGSDITTSIAQYAQVDWPRKHIYWSQKYTGNKIPSYVDPNTFQSYIIARTDINGNFLDEMWCIFGGHGSHFGIEYINNKIYIYSSYEDYDRNELWIVRFPYTAGKTININDSSVEKLYKTGDLNSLTYRANFDSKNQMLLFVAGVSNPTYYVCRKTDILRGYFNALFTMRASDFGFDGQNQTYQSACLDYPYVYTTTGGTYDTQPKKLYCVDIRTKKLVYHITYQFNKGTITPPYSSSTKEPEAISCFYDEYGTKWLVQGFAFSNPNAVPKINSLFKIVEYKI